MTISTTSVSAQVNGSRYDAIEKKIELQCERTGYVDTRKF